MEHPVYSIEDEYSNSTVSQKELGNILLLIIWGKVLTTVTTVAERKVLAHLLAESFHSLSLGKVLTHYSSTYLGESFTVQYSNLQYSTVQYSTNTCLGKFQPII